MGSGELSVAQIAIPEDNRGMTNKYTLKKGFHETITGYEKVVWYVMDGEFVVDGFSLRRDAKHYMDLWNSIAARDSIK